VYVLGSGSAGASSQRLPDEMRNNTFGIYEPVATSLRVRVEEFTPRSAPRAYLETELPF
jgi:hypothetical protein